MGVYGWDVFKVVVPFNFFVNDSEEFHRRDARAQRTAEEGKLLDINTLRIYEFLDSKLRKFSSVAGFFDSAEWQALI
jgi:hypothetical protein